MANNAVKNVIQKAYAGILALVLKNTLYATTLLRYLLILPLTDQEFI